MNCLQIRFGAGLCVALAIAGCSRSLTKPASDIPLGRSRPITSDTQSGNSSQAPACAGSSDASSEGPQAATVAPASIQKPGSIDTPSSTAPANDPRVGVPKPSDDTRINSGAGNAAPLGTTGTSAQ